ncbi:MAG: hypothetical protein U9O54_02740, partial [Chloroflexota bacterium]|nr:hypothetical protein [Chloroflexota bacterium]
PSKTPRVTPTPTPTPTLVYSATPTPEDEFAFTIVVEENGWSRYTYPASDFSISVSPKWVHFDLGVDDFDEMLAEIDRNHPGVAQLYSVEYIRYVTNMGMKFLVIDVSAIEYGEKTDLNIVVSDLKYDIDFDTYVSENIQVLKEEYGTYLNVEEKRIQMAGVETAELIYELETVSAEEESTIVVVVQYLLIAADDEMAYVLTFTTLEDTFEAKYPQILEIAQSLKLSD